MLSKLDNLTAVPTPLIHGTEYVALLGDSFVLSALLASKALLGAQKRYKGVWCAGRECKAVLEGASYHT